MQFGAIASLALNQRVIVGIRIYSAADKTTLATADKMLENSNRRSYLLKLSCAGCHCGLLGKRAEVRDSVLGTIGGLAVRKVSYSADSKAPGTYKVTVTAKSVAVSKVTLNKTTLTLETGSEAVLVATVAPSNATNKKVTF